MLSEGPEAAEVSPMSPSSSGKEGTDDSMDCAKGSLSKRSSTFIPICEGVLGHEAIAGELDFFVIVAWVEIITLDRWDFADPSELYYLYELSTT